MKGDRVEILVDAGGGVQQYEIVATRAGRRIEVSTARGVVEVTEVTRSGTPVRSGRFMASRLVALVEHPALESPAAGVEETTRRRLGRGAEEGGPRRGRGARAGAGGHGLDQLELLGPAGEPSGPEEPPWPSGAVGADEPADGETRAGP